MANSQTPKAPEMKGHSGPGMLLVPSQSHADVSSQLRRQPASPGPFTVSTPGNLLLGTHAHSAPGLGRAEGEEAVTRLVLPQLPSYSHYRDDLAAFVGPLGRSPAAASVPLLTLYCLSINTGLSQHSQQCWRKSTIVQCQMG